MPETETEQGRAAGTSAGDETINAPNQPGSSVSGEGGGDVLVGNSYGNRFWITHPNDRVQEPVSGGVDTMIGWTSLKLAPNVENLQVNGAFNYAVGNELGNLIVVDDQTHWVYGAAGDDVLVGGPTAKITYVVKAGEGSDVIYNFNGNSQIQLLGYGAALDTPQEIRSAMTQVGSDVVLSLSSTETLTFRGISLGSFADRQFLTPLDWSKVGQLTFADEFDTLQIYDHSLQTGIWRADFGNNLKDEWAYTITSNGERQVYTTDHFYGQGERQLDHYTPHSVSNGILTIRAERLLDEDREAAWGREYSSGMLNTMGMFEQRFGYFEMRAELPTAHGAWPAFWMMPTPYVAQVEADIMEGLAATPHVDYRRAWGGDTNLYDNAYKIDPSGFHTYGMLWTPTTVTFYYDGVAVLTSATPANWTHPMSLIVNMAVGGWGGEPNSLEFPAEMKVDYVRAYNLADGSAEIERGTPEPPAATLRADGGLTSGQANVTTTFEDSGQPVTTAKIAVYGAKPTTLPPEKTFVIWEDSGAVFGAVSNGGTLAQPTGLMAGSSSAFTGTGTWLSDGKVVFGALLPDGAGKAAWAYVFDPVTKTFLRHELGASTGDIDFVATKSGGFVASWDAPGGATMARGYDAFAYDGEGWYGPARQVAGDVTGVTATGELITTTAGGQQQLYDLINPPRGVDAIISIGPMAGVSHTEGNVDGTLYTFTLTRDWDQSQKSTVAWQVRGQGGNPADALDFVGGALPSGVVTFEINQTTAYVQVFVQGDAYTEGNEEFLVTLLNPVGAKLGQATATGFITNDDTGGSPPPPPPTGGTTTLGFSTGSVTLNEGDSGTTAFSFTVARTGPTTGSSTVNWTVGGAGSAPATGADFAGGGLPTGTLTFAAGETTKTVTVNVAGDTAVEQTEAFTVTLSGATGATIGTATATGTITNDDSAPPPSGPPVVGFSTTSLSLAEGNSGTTVFGYTVTRSGNADAPASVNWSIAPNGTSGADAGDFAPGTPYGGTLTFAAGETSKVLSFDILGDTSVEGDDGFILTLSGAAGADLGNATATGVILDDDAGSPPPPASPQISLTTTTLSQAEGNSGLTAFSYTVSRTGSTSGTSTVNWSVTGSGAAPASGADFAGGALPSGTLTFAAGETSKTIVVNVAGDTTAESGEGFTLTLAGASGATLGAATATGTIVNDDASSPPPSGGQVINSPGPGSTLTGGAGDDTLNASQGADVLTGGGGGDSFAYAALPWSAGRITDFAVGSDRLDLSGIFQASGYTGTDPVADGRMRFESDGSGGTRIYFDRDAPNTGDWPFLVTTLQGVSPTGLTWAQLSGGSAPPPASPQISLGTSAVTLAEGDSGLTAFSYTVTRTGSTTGTSSVNWTVSGTGASPASAGDFQATTGTLTFAAGEASKTITVNVVGDTSVEPTETFALTLSGASGATLGTATASGTITNDDSGTPPPGPQLSLSTASVTQAEGNSGFTAFSYIVTRTGSTTGTSSATWTVSGSGSSPASAADFQATTGTVTFAAGETSKTITVNVAGDTAVEPTEAFTLTLSGASGATLGTATASGTITNDDTSSPPPGGGQVINSPGPGSTLTGGTGNDTLNASQGPDVLTGGGGGDTFAWANEPWSPARITDFTLGSDRLDLSALLQRSGYTGADPVADKYIWLLDDGAGGTKVLFDRDGAAAGQQWPNYILHLEGVPTAGLTWGQLTGGAEPPPPPPPPPPPSGPSVMVVFAGQSNMGAYNTSPSNVSAAWQPDPKTLIWNEVTHAWEQLQPGVNTSYPGDTDGWGPEVQFAIDFRAKYPDTILRIVKDVEGGSSLARNDASGAYDWSPATAGELFDRMDAMIAEASAAAGGLKPSAVFFGQGETDADQAAMADAYATNLADFFAAVRGEWLDDANGKIGFFRIGSSPPHAAEVRDAQANVDAADTNADSFDTVGFPMQADSVHYTPAGIDRIGESFFDLYEAWKAGGSPPPPTGGQVITSPGPGAHLAGGAGGDTLIASQGADVLTGGGGADHFVFAKENWSPARITDFVHGTDKIDLRGLFDAVGYAGNDPFRDGYLKLIDDGAGGTKVLFDRDASGSDPVWPNYVFQIEHVAPGTLTLSDWIIQ